MVDRRSFLQTLGGAAAATSLAAQPARRYDLLIRNGEIRDPSRGYKQRADVAVNDGRIAAIEAAIPVESGIEVIDAKGLLVCPGLVDLHTHCYHSATGLGVEADPIAARSGVTTWVDAGSFGYDQTPGFRRFIVQPAQTRIFGYVYLYPSSRNPDIDPVKYARGNVRATGQAVLDNRDILLGIKMQVGANMNGRYSYDLLKVARELCDEFRIPMMAHISFAPPETPQVLELMKAGDIVTHAYNGHTLGLVDREGKLRPGVQQARARGVVFDVGHGLGSFNFPAARRLLDAGFPPDTISTDIYNLNINGPVYDMPTTMSKFLHLGMSFDDVLARSTWNPGKVVNRVEGMGTLTPGAPADIALLEIEDGEFRLVDSQKNAVTAKRRVVSRLAFCRGKRIRATL
ncbi:MAG: amidohydrolase/deacetylase family metallohydrolase [Bryobacteraceae bacterium]|nr:amidohydrolase/deacetylase family metallohydrolase [Bryobacteraceae bacterium]